MLFMFTVECWVLKWSAKHLSTVTGIHKTIPLSYGMWGQNRLRGFLIMLQYKYNEIDMWHSGGLN